MYKELQSGKTAHFAIKWHLLIIRKVSNLGLKAEKQLQNKNHTEDWELSSHSHDDGHVTH